MVETAEWGKDSQMGNTGLSQVAESPGAELV